MQNTPDIEGVGIDIIDKKVRKAVILRAISFISVKRNAIERLKEINPQIIHVQGLDMLGAAIKYKHCVNKEVILVYEVADLHGLIIDKQKRITRKIIQRILRKEEKRYCKEIDLLVVTSEKYYSSHFYRFISEEKCVYVPNIPDLEAFRSFSKEKHSSFTVGYLGVIRYKNQIRLLLEASKKTNTKVLMAGYEQDGDEIEQECREQNEVEWIGRFSFMEQAAALYGRCDAIFTVYDADIQNCKVALPNKLYESVYCEIPIIVAKGTYLSDIVEKWGVGVSVKHDDLDDLAETITKLQDPVYYSKIVANCKAHKDDLDSRKYNMNMVKKIRLISERKNGEKND